RALFFALATTGDEQAGANHEERQQTGGDDFDAVVGTEEHHHQDADDERDDAPGEPGEQPHAVLNGLAFSHQALAHAQLGNGDHQVHQQGDGTGAGHEETEHLGGHQVVGDYGEEGSASGEQHGVDGSATASGHLGAGRGVATAAQGVEHARGGVEGGVQ